METITNTIKKTVGITPSPDDQNRIIRLACQVQPYGYGKKGSDSLAARLALATPENKFEIDENQTYGEVTPNLHWRQLMLAVDGRSSKWFLAVRDVRNGSTRPD